MNELTREQVEEQLENIHFGSVDVRVKSMACILRHDAALRQRVEQAERRYATAVQTRQLLRSALREARQRARDAEEINRIAAMQLSDKEAELAKAQARVKELEKRLEIDHVFNLSGERVELPEERRASFPDGIQARDETIRLLEAALAERDRTIARLTEEKDDAYLQRNYVVAALARCFPSGVRKTNIEGWSADWHGCVYIDLPAGQISYHYHDSQAGLFHGLPAYEKPYDGHTKQQVHDRLSSANAMATIARLREALERWGVVTEDTQP